MKIMMVMMSFIMVMINRKGGALKEEAEEVKEAVRTNEGNTEQSQKLYKYRECVFCV